MKCKINYPIWKVKVFISNCEMERNINYGIKQGLILEDGTPIKCFKCGSTNTEEYNHDYMEHMICEFSVKCSDCGQQLGNWAYGNWQL